MIPASKDLGAGRLATFTGVTLPLAGPGVAAAVLLTYIPMCGDYSITATNAAKTRSGVQPYCSTRSQIA